MPMNDLGDADRNQYQLSQIIHKSHQSFDSRPLVRARMEAYRFRCAALLVEWRGARCPRKAARTVARKTREQTEEAAALPAQVAAVQ